MSEHGKKAISIKEIKDKFGLVLLFLFTIIVFAFLNPNFLTVANWSRMLIGQVTVGFMGIAAYFILVIGEFDMSIGYMLGFVLMSGAFTAQSGGGTAMVILVMLLAGAVAGLVNGILTVLLHIPSAIATLGVGILLYGITLAMSNGKVLSRNIPQEIVNFSRGRFLEISYPIYLLALIFILLIFVMNKTPFGKRLYAIGGNTRAAYLSGVKTNYLRIMVFVISGIFIALAAIIILGQAQSANPARGPEYLMSAYATVYLSVVVFLPGTFNIQGVVLSLVLLGAGFNGLSLLGTPFWFEYVFYGLILLLAVLSAAKDVRAARAG